MNRETALRRDFSVSKARIKIERRYLRAGYRLLVPREAKLTVTGRFVLFRLRPKPKSGRHAFWARWDNSTRRGRPGPGVKIELDHPSAAERAAFRNDRNGYSGHWPAFDPHTDKYHIAILDRGRPVFRGALSLSPILAMDFAHIHPGEFTFELERDGEIVAEVAAEVLGPMIIKFARLVRKERRKGRTEKLAARLAWREMVLAGFPNSPGVKLYLRRRFGVDPRGPKGRE